MNLKFIKSTPKLVKLIFFNSIIGHQMLIGKEIKDNSKLKKTKLVSKSEQTVISYLKNCLSQV